MEHLQQSEVKLPDDVGEGCVRLFLDKSAQLTPTLDHLIALVLRQSLRARSYFAQLLDGSTTNEMFERVCKIGNGATSGLVSVLLDAPAWPSEETRERCEKDIFMLLLANLLAAGGGDGSKSMKEVARLLATDSVRLSPLVDADCFQTMLSNLDMRLPVENRSQATLATAKYLEASKETGQKILSEFITSRVTRGTDDERVVAFSAAAAVFPIVPSIASSLFLTKGFVESLIDLLQNKTKNVDVIQAALEMFSAACIDRECREAIAKHGSEWLASLVTANQEPHASTAAVVLAKIDGADDGKNIGKEAKVSDAGADVLGLVARFKDMMTEDTNGQNSIEGLAYASLQPKVKEDLAKDKPFLERLVKKLQELPDKSPVIFGGLTVLANLTAYLPNLSEEQRRISQLKAYADTKKAQLEPDALEQEDKVTARCRKVIDAGAVPMLIATKRAITPTVLTLKLNILLSLSKEQKHRGRLAQMGAVRLLLQVQSTPYDSLTTSKSRYTASLALARILISVDPALVFTSASALPIAEAARPLMTLLADPTASSAISSPGPRDLLPTYEGLLALTNLASHDQNTATVVSMQMLPALDALLLSSNTHLQRAAVELLCNTATAPYTAHALSADSAAARQRLHVLLALADAPDVGTRRAAGGALAMLTGWEDVVAAVLRRARAAEMLLALCGPDEQDDVLLRGVVCLRNVVCAPEPVRDKAREAVRAAGGVDVLKSVLKRSRNAGVLETGVEALKALVE